MSQQARPVEDLINAGWSPPTVYTQINAAVPDDSTFVTDSPCGAEFEVRLARLAAPVVGPNEIAHTLTIRLAGPANVLVELLQDDTLIAWDTFAPGPGFNPYTLTLSRTEAAKIIYPLGPGGDPDLRVRVTTYEGCGSGSGGACGLPWCTAECSACEVTPTQWSVQIGDGPATTLCYVDGDSCAWVSTDLVYELQFESDEDAWVLTNQNTGEVWAASADAWVCNPVPPNSNELFSADGGSNAVLTPLYNCPLFGTCDCLDTCPDGVPTSYQFTLSGATGVYAGLNGPWTLAHTLNCGWTDWRNGWAATATVGLDSGVQLTLSITDGTQTIVWQGIADACCDVFEMVLISPPLAGLPDPPMVVGIGSCGPCIFTPCCPNPLPTTLVLRLSGLTGNYTCYPTEPIPLMWDGVDAWVSDELTFCVGTQCPVINGQFSFGCFGGTNDWSLSGPYVEGDQTSYTCSPFSVQITMIDNGCGPGTVIATITTS